MWIRFVYGGLATLFAIAMFGAYVFATRSHVEVVATGKSVDPVGEIKVNCGKKEDAPEDKGDEVDLGWLERDDMVSIYVQAEQDGAQFQYVVDTTHGDDLQIPRSGRPGRLGLDVGKTQFDATVTAGGKRVAPIGCEEGSAPIKLEVSGGVGWFWGTALPGAAVFFARVVLPVLALIVAFLELRRTEWRWWNEATFVIAILVAFGIVQVTAEFAAVAVTTALGVVVIVLGLCRRAAPRDRRPGS